MFDKFVLCPARHSHYEIDGLPSVFDSTDNPFNAKFSDAWNSCAAPDAVTVYVTGATPCLVKLIKECIAKGTSLTLMQYDSSVSAYIKETIL